jgi:hypothetical protein
MVKDPLVFYVRRGTEVYKTKKNVDDIPIIRYTEFEDISNEYKITNNTLYNQLNKKGVGWKVTAIITSFFLIGLIITVIGLIIQGFLVIA